MKNLPIDAIRAFVTAAELGSISTTAEQLGRSQPAISLQIKRLEEILGKELLIRSNRKLKLSHSGEQVYDLCKQLLASNDQVIAQLSDEELAGQVTLGIPSEFATTLLPNIVGRFAQAYPNVRMEVFSDLSRHLTSESQRGLYDLILALHDKHNAERRGFIRSDELVWVGTKDTQIDHARELPLVLAQDGCLYRKRALRKLDQLKRQWRIVHTNPDLAGIKAAITTGLGLTVLAKSTVPEGLAILDTEKFRLPELGTIDISLQYKRRSASDSVDRLAEFIRAGLA